MSIESMCRGTTVKRKIYSRTPAIGAAGGNATTGTTDARTRECGAQDDSGGSVDTRSDAKANRSSWTFLFAVDPELAIQDELVVLRHQGTNYSTPRTFRVNGTHIEGNPSGTLKLWVVDAEEF